MHLSQFPYISCTDIMFEIVGSRVWARPRIRRREVFKDGRTGTAGPRDLYVRWSLQRVFRLHV